MTWQKSYQKLSQISEEAKSLDEACRKYEKFVKGMLEKGVTEEILGNLSFLIKNWGGGN